MYNGRIAERGSHDELLGKDGVQKELWTAQLSAFALVYGVQKYQALIGIILNTN